MTKTLNQFVSLPYFTVAVGIGVVSLTTYYVFWGLPIPNKKKKRGPCLAPGLVNFGNTCFLNAVLQALSCCKEYRKLLTENYVINAHALSNESLTFNLINILKALNNEGETEIQYVLSASGILSAMRRHQWFMSRDDQDAHEMFQLLISTVEDEFTSIKPSFADVNNILTDENPSKLPSSLCPRKYKCCFKGLIVNTLKCQFCSYQRSGLQFDSFNCLSLSIPEYKLNVSLEDCIEHFVKPELVHDVNCDNCAKNVETKQSKSTFMKQLLFGMFPQCLCILIQRTIWTNTGTPIKLNNHVSFPVILNLGHYKHESFKTSMHLLKSSQLDTNRNSSDVSHNDSAKHENSTTFMWPLLFKLQAVVVHIGHATCGHYITYRNVSVDSKKSRWLYTSDTEVRTASVSEVTQSNAYMLFYEKIK